MNYSKTTVVGRLTKEAKIFPAAGEKSAMAAFTVAVNRGTGDKATVSYFEVELRGKSAESTSKFLVKGKEVLVDGTIEAVAYAKNDGTPGASLKLYAYEITLGADAAEAPADPI